ncbi:MAG: metallophosphoesterase [Thermoplasmata archaeon]|nr:metallophosphoesterase [Candidatus Sysuiplasma acidicola]MBX8646974.1 metallophosphoesterase [Candidatus Sysuiplasma acidicola]MDH2905497.1 metallophosphoesterase [Methanomassiliicoccales archaeon]
MPKEYRICDDIVISGYGIVYMPNEETIGISDLHLGFEVYMESRGLFLPRMQMKLEEERIESILREYQPSTVLINGDVKHEFGRNTMQEWLEIRRLFTLLTDRCRVTVVRGNHDNYIINIARTFGIRVVRSQDVGRAKFAHGDVRVDSRKDSVMIIGHEHPAIRIVDSVGGSYKFPAFLYFDEDPLLILPAFSPFALGTDVLSNWEEFMSPYLKGRDGGNAIAFAVTDGKLKKIGRLSDIRGADISRV